MSLKKKPWALPIIAALLAAPAFASAATIVKTPNLGKYWNALSVHGTYTYANSFVAPVAGAVTELGMWLKTYPEIPAVPDPSELQFKVFGSIGGNPVNGPDASAVLASTAVLPGQSFADLTFLDVISGISSVQLAAGQTYWFAATTVGLNGSDEYQVGGHSQNSGGIVDNGTFWYSNAPNGLFFNGPFTPEMAFSVTVAPVAVPEPASCALLGLGLVLGFMSRRRA